jgi:hypothetical protein
MIFFTFKAYWFGTLTLSNSQTFKLLLRIQGYPHSNPSSSSRSFNKLNKYNISITQSLNGFHFQAHISIKTLITPKPHSLVSKAFFLSLLQQVEFKWRMWLLCHCNLISSGRANHSMENFRLCIKLKDLIHLLFSVQFNLILIMKLLSSAKPLRITPHHFKMTFEVPILQKRVKKLIKATEHLFHLTTWFMFSYHWWI